MLVSGVFTYFVAEQFPSLEIDSRMSPTMYGNITYYDPNTGNITTGNITRNVGEILYGNSFIDFGQSELHNYCTKGYNNSFFYKNDYILDEDFIKVGDPLEVQYEITISKGKIINREIFAGIKPNQLKKVDVGLTDLGMIYYHHQNITVYHLMCFNQETFWNMTDTERVTIHMRGVIKRPSYVDNFPIKLTIFIATFVLLGSFMELIYKILKCELILVEKLKKKQK